MAPVTYARFQPRVVSASFLMTLKILSLKDIPSSWRSEDKHLIPCDIMEEGNLFVHQLGPFIFI
jgi:hypothetical protein